MSASWSAGAASMVVVPRGRRTGSGLSQASLEPAKFLDRCRPIGQISASIITTIFNRERKWD
jgi:hypothetical protein